MPRYAMKTTIDELKDIIETLYKEYCEKNDCDEYLPDINIMYVMNMVPSNDFKVKFDFENYHSPFEEYGFSDLVGFYQLNGFAVAIYAAGGDWEKPVHFAVYAETNKKLRVYIPTLGNTWNVYTKTAFGSEEENPKFKEKLPADFFEDDDFSELYYKWEDYIYDSRNIGDMLDDIAARIHVKGNNVIPTNKKPLKYKKGMELFTEK